jgi:hypothetical protein
LESEEKDLSVRHTKMRLERSEKEDLTVSHFVFAFRGKPSKIYMAMFASGTEMGRTGTAL